MAGMTKSGAAIFELTPQRRALALLTYVCEPRSVIARAAHSRDPVEVVDAVLDGEFGLDVKEAAAYRWNAVDIDSVLGQLAERQEGAAGSFVTAFDQQWPQQLNDLDDPPLGLWVKGRAVESVLAMSCVAIVGARAATQYGQQLALRLAAEVASREFAITSGGAYGIDAAAHRGALTTGFTICVLASGIDTAYPAGHAQLFDDIANSGVLISEVPPHEPARRFRFLNRNRIIAALSRGTVVVEASLRSGSLGTARRARDLGRMVMAVPGPVTSDTSAGCHELLRTDPGALLVTCAADVMDVVGTLGLDAVGWRSGPHTQLDSVSDDARVVYDYICVPMTAAAVRLECGLSAAAVAAALTELFAHGLAVRVGERWTRA